MRWILILALFAACATRHEAHEETHWSYGGDTGPEHWAELDPAYAAAANGTSQSPVDLSGARVGDAGEIEFHYAESAFQLVNNGHSVQLNVEVGSWFQLDGTRYDLKQIHFHAPSEHTIDRVYSDMEVHCVHEDEEGRLAVVGLLVAAGESAPNFEEIFEHVPEVGGKTTIPDVRKDLSEILPKDLGHFYHYPGSLTTPPCTEGVEWIIMLSPKTASAEQIERFRQFYLGNNRPTQPLNDRVIMVE